MKAYHPTPARLSALGFTHQPTPIAPDSVRSFFDSARPTAQMMELRTWPGHPSYCLVRWQNQVAQLYAYAEWTTERSFLANLQRALSPLAK